MAGGRSFRGLSESTMFQACALCLPDRDLLRPTPPEPAVCVEDSGVAVYQMEEFDTAHHGSF